LGDRNDVPQDILDINYSLDYTKIKRRRYELLKKKRKRNPINSKKIWLLLPVYVIYIIVYELYLGVNLFELLGNIIFPGKQKRK